MRLPILLIGLLASMFGSTDVLNLTLSDLARTQLRQLPGTPLAETELFDSTTGRHQYRTPTSHESSENLACLVGRVYGNTVVVDSIVVVKSDRGDATWVIPDRTGACNGITHTVGIVHSHPFYPSAPERSKCFYFFPGTIVATSDADAASKSPYLIDAIACGSKLVWINKKQLQQQMVL